MCAVSTAPMRTQRKGVPHVHGTANLLQLPRRIENRILNSRFIARIAVVVAVGVNGSIVNPLLTHLGVAI